MATARRVFVSGGSGDLGAAVVTDLAAAGHQVWFQYGSSEQRAADLAARSGATPVHGDYGEDDLVGANLLPPGLEVDILVCCAGMNPSAATVHETSPSVLRHALNVNLMSAFRLTQRCLPTMLAAGWGRIVYLNSVFGTVAGPLNSSYNIAKAATHGLCRSVVADYPGSGVTANEVVAGPVRSRMLAKIVADRAAAADVAAVRERLARRVPARRLAEPADVAAAVRFLVGEDAGYLTGSTVTVDGGMLSVG
ncbi:NAD(P)-dependent dehydrogenase (short-subunit alcohol dehydrogenase family) [Actinokineospora baliensis]|uniref:SDR family NAD(P)-dependent oxidoreductase n=1 Tax=Actinokineospora baliensis TaxID=547056 RepID=UPI00195BB057|nr:SDR family oxidoreductase [Actinokineospora baliensis]MBM7774529.1 NAD(P)-dependent dehydrogenase (short-subunit alcohol dehydrogenase family) [Actinokineospora baliensis]